MMPNKSVLHFCVGFVLVHSALMGQEGFHNNFTDGFRPSEVYSLSKLKLPQIEDDLSIPYDDESTYQVYLLKGNDTILQVFEMNLAIAYFSSLDIWVNTSPQIKGIKNIIMARSVYSSCGAIYTLKYFVETIGGKFIELPQMESTNDGNQFHYWQYRFPNEKFGIKNKVVMGYLDVTQAHELSSFQKEKVFLWDGEKLIPDK